MLTQIHAFFISGYDQECQKQMLPEDLEKAFAVFFSLLYSSGVSQSGEYKP